MTELSAFQKERLEYIPPTIMGVENPTEAHWKKEKEALVLTLGQSHKPSSLKVGVVLSGGPAPGGHNVIWGILDALKKLSPSSKLIGFLGGPSGIIEDKCMEITEKEIANYKNMGGFHLLGSGRTKIETLEQFKAVEKVVSSRNLDGLVFIGGDDTNTNAALLADHMNKAGISCNIIGTPKTIDCDMRGFGIETSFGFDTACKVYSEMIGNLAIDAASAGKYWFFVKVMGRKASHIALECALETGVNLCFVGEEVSDKKLSLSDVVDQVVETVRTCSEQGKNYGVVIVPEGLIEFIPEFSELISELNRLLAAGKGIEQLKENTKKVFEELPQDFQEQLLSDRDPHGNVAVSHIETEKLLMKMVKQRLEKSSFKGKFQPVSTFMGYEARCSAPSDFDATYCYNLGAVAALLVRDQKTGYMAGVRNLAAPVSEWRGIGVSLAHMMTEEERKGEKKKVIQKVLVDLNGPVFKEFKAERERNRLGEFYQSPGPMQCGKKDNFLINNTLRLESKVNT